MEFHFRITLCTLILHHVLLRTTCISESTTWTNNLDTEENNNCSSILYAEEEKTFRVPLENPCKIYVYNFTSSDKHSIINVGSAIKRLRETIAHKSESIVSEHEIVVGFFESNEQMKVWKVTDENATEKHVYLSRTPSLKMEISVIGNWSDYDVVFRYKEYKFVTDPHSKQCTDLKGEISSQEIPELGQYRPNSVTVYTLTKLAGRNISSIQITFHYLDIDVTAGEYILIGAGKKLFQSSPPLFIASNKKTAKYLVNDENAYIVFVSGSTRFPHRGFNISYEQLETEILFPKDKPWEPKRDDVLQSMPICFYNVSDALQEFNKSDKDKAFEKFREEFAKEALNYAKIKKLSAARYLNASYIQLFRVSGIVKYKKEDGFIDEALYVMMKVRGEEEGKAAFTREELKRIIDIYETRRSNVTNEYKIGKCPPEYLYSIWWDVGIYASLPMLFCLFLMVWAWKRKILQESCFWTDEKLKNKITKEFERGVKKRDENATQVKGNMYGPEPSTTTVPKLQLVTTTGRRYTLDPRNSFTVNVEGENSNGESPSTLNDVQDPSCTANQQIEECCHPLETISLIPKRTKKNEADHVYDSVKSVDSIRNEHQTLETKL